MGKEFLNTYPTKTELMSKVTMICYDLHDRTILLKVAVRRSKPSQVEFLNNSKDRCKMTTALKKTASFRRIFANLYTELLTHVRIAAGNANGISPKVLQLVLDTKKP